jgi:hypothetical protein
MRKSSKRSTPDLRAEYDLEYSKSKPNRFTGKMQEPKNLAETLKKIDGKDYTSTFEKYVWGMEMPGGK